MIQALYLDPDFQSKMANFVPVSYAVTDKKLTVVEDREPGEETEDAASPVKDSTADNDTYERMKELINNP